MFPAAAIRFFRACLKINTHYMFRYLNKGDVFAPVLELLANASPRDNMLSSACLELFEFMRKVLLFLFVCSPWPDFIL